MFHAMGCFFVDACPICLVSKFLLPTRILHSVGFTFSCFGPTTGVYDVYRRIHSDAFLHERA